MNYEKFNLGSYQLHVIKTNKFKTITVTVNFKRKIKKEEITIRNVLNDMLICSTKKYPSRREIEIQTEDLYNLEAYSNTSISGKYSSLSVNATFLNEKYTEEGMNKKSIDFVMDLIFNPNVSNNAFKEDCYQLIKQSTLEEIESIKEEPRLYSMMRTLEEMDKTNPLSFHSCGYKEDLDKIDVNSLYEYYLSVLKSDIIDIFVVGDVDINKIKEEITNKFKINTLKRKTERSFIDYDKFRARTKIIKESFDINQSKLVLGCKLANLTEEERKYTLLLYSYILGGSPDSKLFKTVREKNSLCYYIGSNVRAVGSILTISSGINKENYKKTVSLIKKEIKNMEKGNFDESDLEKAKITYIASFKELLDSPRAIINNYLAHEYLNYDLIEDRIKNIETITKDMVVAVSKKVHLDTIYLLEGDSENEE